MNYLIGIDIGTGSTKAIAWDIQSQKSVAIVQKTYDSYQPLPNYHEQNPDHIWAAFKQCIDSIIEQCGKPEAVGISSAMHSLMSVAEDGTPLTNLITWADGRSVNQAMHVLNLPGARTLYETTGTPIHAMSPLPKIMWLRDQQPEIFEHSYKFISIKEYVWYKLFQCFEVDYSIASASGLFDDRTKEWSTLALQTAGIDANRLSTPVPCTHKRIINDPKDKAADVTFVIGGSDGCLASLGSGITKPGSATLTIGTSGALRIAGPTPVLDFESMIFNYHLDDNTYISGGAINNGGAVWNWYSSNLINASSPEEVESMIESMSLVAGSEGLIFLPYLFGERAPVWNSKASGVFFGINGKHNQAHFTRSVLEGITMALYTIYLRLRSDSVSIEKIYASGGFTRSAKWLQIVADVFGKNVVVRQAEDASALGAIMMAFKAVTSSSEYPVLSTLDERIVQPDKANHRVYTKQIMQFERLYELLKPEMDRRFDYQNESSASR